MARTDRIALFNTIEQKRDSHLIAYITSDRMNATAQIGSEAIRPLYDHIRSLGFAGVDRIDLFIYSMGGAVDVPWRLVTMVREYCKEFNVLIPFHAHSAATLLSLGADHIVLGKKGELGPIDPILTPSGKQTDLNPMSVEDIMAFITFLKDRAGLGDQSAISDQIRILVEKLTPWTIGEMYRIHSHIRLIARKLLTSRSGNIEEQVVNTIIDTLAEKMYFHGHAIGCKEARQIGLPIEEPDEQLDELMWQLLEKYEDLMQIRDPFNPLAFIPQGQNEHSVPTIFACIESTNRTDVFRGDMKFHNVRKTPPQLNLNLNLQLQLPPNLPPETLPAQLQQVIQQAMQTIQAQAAQLIQSELNKQSPIERVEGGLVNGKWQNITTEDI